MDKLFQYWDLHSINRVHTDVFQEKMIVYGLAPNDLITERLLKFIIAQQKIKTQQ